MSSSRGASRKSPAGSTRLKPNPNFFNSPSQSDGDVSGNSLEALPDGLERLTVLRSFNLSENRLNEIPPNLGEMRNLTKLSLSENKLKALPPLVGLERITEIDLSQNQLNEFPIIRPGNTLKSLLLSFNKIQTLQDDRLTHLSSLTILTLRENKLTMLPDSIVQLNKLERLDLTNNDLSSLPYMLGRFESLHSLLLDGNPLKSIRRDILRKGTVELLKYLRSRIEEPEEHVSPPTSPSSLKVSPSPFKEGSPVGGVARKEVVLTKANLTELPHECFEVITVATFNVSYNKLTLIPHNIGLLRNLVTLDVRKNLLDDLPSSLSSCSSLRSLIISFNRFSSLPDVIYDCPSLETLLASDNQISFLNVDGFLKMRSLTTLDVSNNDISQVPPQLGLVQWLKHLELGGNSFRNPRPAVLGKGTASLLEYLRDRIPT